MKAIRCYIPTIPRLLQCWRRHRCSSGPDATAHVGKDAGSSVRHSTTTGEVDSTAFVRETGSACRNTRVLVVADHYPPAVLAGGPIRTLSALVDAAPREFEIAILTSDRDLGSSDRLKVRRNCWTEFEGSTCYYASMDRPLRAVSAWRAAREWSPDIVYLNSFFSPSFSIVPQLLVRVNWWSDASLLIAPRGELNPGALSQKSAKKAMYLGLYGRMALAKHAVWHASSEDEARAVAKALQPAQTSIVIREDDTALPSEPLSPSFGLQAPLRTIFLGRISPIKGVDIIIEALSQVDQSVNLDIFGPLEDADYVAKCMSLCRNLPENVTVVFRGPIPHKDVCDTLLRYEVSLLPTNGENFGHSIAESLSASCPVMCTPFTPWTHRLRIGGGVVVSDRSVQNWAVAISEYAMFSAAERMGRRALAGQVYREWMAESKGPHVLELLITTTASGAA